LKEGELAMASQEGKGGYVQRFGALLYLHLDFDFCREIGIGELLSL